MPRHILTAVAWPYANGPRHIGHVSGFGVPSDVFSRYMRMAGHHVLMVSGTDEHGTPIQVQADARGHVDPRARRPLQPRHRRGPAAARPALRPVHPDDDAQPLRRRPGAVQPRCTATATSSPRPPLGAISPSTGRTLPDRYIEGTCPICGYDGARGDQCDNCGNQLDPTDLINPRSRINGETPKFVETEHFFLDLPAFAEALGAWLSERTDWRPNVLKFSTNLLDDLQPRAITRDLDWGVPIPLEGWDDRHDKRIYVWFDAVIGYLSASIEWARRTGDPDAWRQWWQPDDAPTRRRTTSWARTTSSSTRSSGRRSCSGTTARVTAAASPGGSASWVCRPRWCRASSSPWRAASSRPRGRSSSTCATSSTRYDADALRYFIAVAGPETQDTDFTWAEFVRRNNDELVAGWGNLVNRTVSMAAKNFGSIPRPAT